MLRLVGNKGRFVVGEMVGKKLLPDALELMNKSVGPILFDAQPVVRRPCSKISICVNDGKVGARFPDKECVCQGVFEYLFVTD